MYIVRCRYRTAAFPLLLIGDRRSLRVVQYDRLKARFLYFVSTHEKPRSPLPRLDRQFDMAWYVLHTVVHGIDLVSDLVSDL